MGCNTFNLARLRDELRPMRLHWCPRLRSTNDHAALLRRRRGLFAPAIVLAGAQVGGRGRGGNSWWSDSGSLTFTLVLPINENLLPHQLALTAGLAVRDAVAELTGRRRVALKWPNDVMFEGRKLAGLLCERTHRADMIGIGINVNSSIAIAPPRLRRRITSMARLAGASLDKSTVLAVVARRVHAALRRHERHAFTSVLRRYDGHHMLRGRSVRVSTADDGNAWRGTCRGVDELGRLLVRDDRRKMHRIAAGSVQMR